jgi:putative salt-induced outer membrane protein YdiY
MDRSIQSWLLKPCAKKAIRIIVEIVVIMIYLSLAMNVRSEVIWQSEVSAGYNKSGGNTETEQVYGNLFINRNNKHIDEWTLKGDTFNSSTDDKRDGQKRYGMLRYAFSFGDTKKWYNFYRIEGDHDWSAHIDYRITPATGVGYWFFDLPDLKLMAEVAFGREYTEYIDFIKDRDEDFKDREEGELIPRAYFEKGFFEKSKITQNIIAYPALDDLSNYRVRSETIFTTAITDTFSLSLSLLEEYTSDPPQVESDPSQEIDNHDWRFMTSLTLTLKL